MALQGSGAISLNEIHIEAGGSSGTEASLNDTDIRGLIGKGSGVQMAFNEWYGASAALYSFTSHTFTTGGQGGRLGGDLNDFTTAYSSETWAQNTAYFNVATDGFQRWTVPETADYNFVVAGAQGGGGGGYGAKITFTIGLEQGDKLLLAVGHRGVNTQGLYRPSSGGGASGVFSNAAAGDAEDTNDSIIAVAGGGGGRSYGSNSGLTTNMHGSATTSGYTGVSYPAWNNYAGGSNGYGGAYAGGTGGAGTGGGIYGNGGDQNGSYGFSKYNGWMGGNTRTSGQEKSTGAFGGSGGASVNSGNYRGGGGGGGYSGGGSGVGDGYGSAGRGGGGGSFCAGNGAWWLNFKNGASGVNTQRTISNRTIYGGSTTNTNGNSLSAGNATGAADGYISITKV